MALKGRQQSNGLRGKLSNISLPKPNVSLPDVSMPKLDGSAMKAIGGAATQLAKGTEKLGELTAEVKAVREAVDQQKQQK